MTRRRLWLLGWVTGCALALVLPAAASTRVLVLHAYHHGYRWTDDISAGLEQGLEEAGAPPVELYYEYLDTKRYPAGEHLPPFAALLAEKYRDTGFAAVVVCDNNAFAFLRRHRDRLFPGVPVVFCGINFLHPADLAGMTAVTGVSEDADFRSTVDLALRLHPGTRRLAVVVDDTTTGRRLRPRLEQLADAYRDRLAVEFLTHLSAAELRARLGRLGPGDLVLYTVFFRDRLGRFLEYDASARLVAEASPVPVYATWDFSLGSGMVGGMLTSGRAQGRAAAGLLARVLAGTPADAIPVVTDSPNRYLFDWPALERFAIPVAALPPGSAVLRRPESLYRRYPRVVHATAAGLAVLVAAVVFLVADAARRRRVQRTLAASERELAATVARLREEARERERAEGELRAQTRATEAAERRYRSLFEEAPTMYVITRAAAGEPVIEDCNGEFLRALGYPREQVVGQPLTRFYSPELAHALRNGGYLGALEEGIGDVERVLVRADGTRLHTLLRANPERDDAGATVRVRAMFVDITERVRAEQELRSLEEQLIQAQKMEAVGTLASGIAHDFNNLLQGISGFAELVIADPAVPATQRARVEQIERSAERAADLVRDLLAFGRKARTELVPTDINGVVRGVAELLERTLPKMIRVELDLAEGTPAVRADPTQLHQVLLNLANNARDAMPDGGRLAFATAAVELDEAEAARRGGLGAGRYLLLSVADTGVGMTRQVQQQIFDPFFTTKEVGEGTGLGLSMVYGIVKNHGGAVACRSEPGRGSVFELLLPAAAAPAPAAAPPGRDDGPATGHETVLVVDDDAVVLEVARTALGASGYRVVCAASGEEALALFEEGGRADLVVLDVGMPGMGGLRCLEELRRVDPRVRVILSTGYGAGAANGDPGGAAADAVLNKPYSLHRLLEAVREVLDR